MSTVYLIRRRDYEDFTVICVCESKDVAEGFIAKLTKMTSEEDALFDADDYEIDPWEITTADTLPLFEINMDQDGRLRNVGVYEWDQKPRAWIQGGVGITPYLYCVLSAQDRDTAVRLVDEMRRELIASGRWVPGNVAL